ncbi:MAG TPA: outer membrane protein assembly factor BamD [Burkholderiaceae bacterium]|jgi:outer membrane protein assembly factor BamD|nr:outer membrane protein assembly factor BamD [Burkholderiaceae bacterium]
MELIICSSALRRAVAPLRTLGRIAALAGVFALASCGSLEKDATAKWDVARLYKEAHAELLAGNWNHARELFEKLESRYPFGRYAQQGQIEIAYAYYKQGETADALDATDRFLKTNPSHPNVDYVYYLKGLINFIEPPALVGRLVGYKVSERDPKAMRDSFEAFKELLTRFPDSRYAPDARVRLSYLQNALAAHEVRVADYYYRRGAYVAAIERAQGALREFPGSAAQREALTLIAQSYGRLGLTELQADAERVLRLNFPAPVAVKNP